MPCAPASAWSLVPRVYVQDDLASGALRAVLDDWRPVQTDIYVVYPSRRHMVAKVRAFIDFLVGTGPPGPEAQAGRRRSYVMLTAVRGDVATVANAAASLQTKATSAATSSGSPSQRDLRQDLLLQHLFRHGLTMLVAGSRARWCSPSRPSWPAPAPATW